MRVKWVAALSLWVVCSGLAAALALPAAAQDIGYFGENRLQFVPVGGSAPPDAAGKGIIDYRGGAEPNSQWKASFRFNGLAPNAGYTVVVKGRFGDSGSREADDFSLLCSFTTDDQGSGSCFWYFQGLARLNVVQLRGGDQNGPRVLQASRSDNTAGSIDTTPNRFSPGGEMSASNAKQAEKASR